MRLKNINISERSSLYSNEQKERLDTISKCINSIGNVFDVIVDLENFIVDKIESSYNSFMKIKINKQSIISKEGSDAYLDYFKLSSEEVNKDINKAIEDWNNLMIKNGTQEYTLTNIKLTLKTFKELYNFILSTSNALPFKLEGFESIKTIMNEFTNFRIYNVLISEDIIDRLQGLIDLNAKIEGKNVKKKLTIDDL